MSSILLTSDCREMSPPTAPSVSFGFSNPGGGQFLKKDGSLYPEDCAPGIPRLGISPVFCTIGVPNAVNPARSLESPNVVNPARRQSLEPNDLDANPSSSSIGKFPYVSE